MGANYYEQEVWAFDLVNYPVKINMDIDPDLGYVHHEHNLFILQEGLNCQIFERLSNFRDIMPMSWAPQSIRHRISYKGPPPYSSQIENLGSLFGTEVNRYYISGVVF